MRLALPRSTVHRARPSGERFARGPRSSVRDEATRTSPPARAKLRPVKIYTKTGDDGTTGLFGGGRVKKASSRVEAYGTVDELNATIGLARATRLDPFADGVL